MRYYLAHFALCCWGVGLLILTAAPLLGQTKLYRVTARQQVVGNELVLDYYIQLLSGAPFSLSSTNFFLQFNNPALNLAGAVMDSLGPWSAAQHPEDYYAPFMGPSDGRLILNLQSKAMLVSQHPGSGQPVTSAMQQVARVRMPILDAGGTSSPTWQLAPFAALLNWQGQNLISLGEFVVTPTSLPLCEVPLKPQLTLTGSTTPCPGQSPTLQASGAGPWVWYNHASQLAGVTGSRLTISSSGVYTALSIAGACSSPAADSVAINFQPAAVVSIQLQDSFLVCQVTPGSLQWLLNGKPLAGATTTLYKPTQGGAYSLQLSNNCGTAVSNTINWAPTITPVANTPLDSLAQLHAHVYPNPFVGSTNLYFTLDEPQPISVVVTDMDGVPVQVLAQGPYAAGKHVLPFQARERGLARGTYLLSFTNQQGTTTFKLLDTQ